MKASKKLQETMDSLIQIYLVLDSSDEQGKELVDYEVNRALKRSLETERIALLEERKNSIPEKYKVYSYDDKFKPIHFQHLICKNNFEEFIESLVQIFIELEEADEKGIKLQNDVVEVIKYRLLDILKAIE